MSEIVDAGGNPISNERVEPIPEDLLKDIKEAEEKRQSLLNNFLNISLKRTKYEKIEQEILKQLDNNEQSLKSKLENAHKKMRLNKAIEYQWQYDGKENFIGRRVNK